MGDKTKYALVVATRPDLIKMSPIVRAMAKRKMEYAVIHGDQHYDDLMDAVFFKELAIDDPKFRLTTTHGSDGRQLRETYYEFLRVLALVEPDVVVVYGDTMSAYAGAMAAKYLDVDVVHVEAGLRSRDVRMREEIYRMMVDVVADVMYCPTETQYKNLDEEGCPGTRAVVGNTILDVVEGTKATAEKESNVLEQLELRAGKYAVMTLHRAENVDDQDWLKHMLHSLERATEQMGTEFVWPLHPRVQKRLGEFKMKLPAGVRGVSPLGYLDFLKLEMNAKLILTDSGGIQEEACVLKVPCVTARRTTERPETVDCGANVMMDITKLQSSEVVRTLTVAEKMKRNWKQPWGTPYVGERIVDSLKTAYND